MTSNEYYRTLGRLLNADFVISGFIRRLGDRKLVITTIVDVETFEQLAGDYREYRTIEDVPSLLPDISRIIINASQRNAAGLPKLAIVPFNIANTGVNVQDAEALAQILSIEIGNKGEYVVLPRTTAIQAAMQELAYQMTGATAEEEAKALGRAINAEYVLNAEVRSLGATNIFTASILNVEDGSLLAGNYRNYRDITDGLKLMAELAGLLISETADAPAPKIAREPRPPREPGTGSPIGYGFMNIALGLGSYLQGDISGGLIVSGGYALSAGLIVWELAGLTYDDPGAGVPGTIGLGIAGATLVFGFIKPVLYSKNPQVAAIMDRITITAVADEQRTNALGICYTHKF